MTKTLSMGSYKNCNFNANQGIVIFLTSKLITCFTDNFTLKMKSQSIAYILNDNEHVYRILDLEDKVHSLWVLWNRGLQECKGNFIFWSRAEPVGSMDFIWVLKEACPGHMWSSPGPCRVGEIDAETRKILLYKWGGGVDLLTFLRKHN